MSNSYQNKIQKHSSFLQKIIEESGKSDNPNIINMSKINKKIKINIIFTLKNNIKQTIKIKIQKKIS